MHKYLAELKYDDAILAYEVAIRIDPKREDAYIGLARAYIGKREYEKALNAIERGISEIGESDALLAYKKDVEEKIREAKREKEREKNLWESKGSISDEKQTDKSVDLNMDKAMSSVDMRIMLEEVIEFIVDPDRRDRYDGYSFGSYEDDWWLITLFAGEVGKELIGGYREYRTDDLISIYEGYGQLCDEAAFKQIMSSINPDFDGKIDHEMLRHVNPRYVSYDDKKELYYFQEAGDRGEGQGISLVGYIDNGFGKARRRNLKKTEPEPSPEPSDDGGEAEITETSEPEITPAPTEAPEPEPAPAVQQSSFPTVPVVIAAIVILAVIVALIISKKKKS